MDFSVSTKRQDELPYIIDGRSPHPGPYPYPFPPEKEQEERLRTTRPGNLFIAQDHDIRVIQNIQDKPEPPAGENRSRRPSSMMSLLKSLTKTDDEPVISSPSSPTSSNALVESSFPAVEHDYGHGHHQHHGHQHHHGHTRHHNQGWHTIHHKHTHDIKEGWGKGHKDKFGLLELVLLGLSLLSLGGFLLNLLLNLLQVRQSHFKSDCLSYFESF